MTFVIAYVATRCRFPRMLTISASVCSSSVKSLVIQDLEKKFEELRDQVVYCFVNDTMTVVELGKYKDFLAN
jgi:hypothetical protein